MSYDAPDFVSDVTELLCTDCPKRRICNQNLEQLYWCLEDMSKRAELNRLM